MLLGIDLGTSSVKAAVMAEDGSVKQVESAGYRVEYRRYYPHLTRQDLARYRTVLVLGGRQPESLSDALTIGDLAILNEWVRRDGVVVLVYAEDGGALDRWIMNRWLGAQGAGIAVGAGTGATVGKIGGPATAMKGGLGAGAEHAGALDRNGGRLRGPQPEPSRDRAIDGALPV